MKRIKNEKQLKSLLGQIEVDPSSDWISNMRDVMSRLDDDVTDRSDFRKPILNNLLVLFAMKGSSKLFFGIGTALVLVVVLGGGAAYASDDAVPGDALYPIDRAVESLRRAVTSDDDRAEFEMDILDERVDELEGLEEDSEYMEEAVEAVDEQLAEVKSRVRSMEEKYQNDEVEDAVRERVWNRYENQLENHLEYMYQVQEQVMEQNETNKPEDAGVKQKVDDIVDEYEEEQKGVNSLSGDGENDGEYYYNGENGNTGENGDGVQIQKHDQDKEGEQSGPNMGDGGSGR